MGETGNSGKNLGKKRLSMLSDEIYNDHIRKYVGKVHKNDIWRRVTEDA